MNTRTIVENGRKESLDELIAFVGSEFAAGRAVDPDEKLIGNLVDSLGIYLVLDFVQARFRVDLTDSELTAENLATTRTLCALVNTKVQERSADVHQAVE